MIFATQKRLTMTSLLALIDQSLVSGGNFATTLIGAHLLTPEDQGKFGYILSVYLIVSILAQVSIYQWASVEAPRASDSYYDSINLLQFLLSILTTGIAVIILGTIGHSSGWRISANEIIVIIFFLLFQQRVDFVRRGAYIFSTVRTSIRSSVLVYPVRLVALLIMRPNDMLGFLVVLGMTAMIPALKSIFDLRYRKNALLGFGQFAFSHFRKTKWLILGGPFTWLWGSVPLFILGTQGNLAQVGIFTTLNSITNAGNVFMELLETPISATAGKIYTDTNDKALNKLMRHALLAGVFLWFIALIVFVLQGRFLLRLLTNDTYASYSALLVILWIDVLFIFLFRLSSVKIRTLGKTNVVFFSLITGTIISGVLSYLLIPRWNVYGAALVFGFAPLLMWLTQELGEKYN